MAAIFLALAATCGLWLAACGFPRPTELPTDDGDNCGDTLTDPLNCGRCGRRCADLPGVDVSRISCAGSRCDLAGACLSGAADCDGDEATGCEADLARPETCGRCGAACPSTEPLCSVEGAGWECRPSCGDAQVACSGSCVDLATDPRHCGRCGHGCDGGTCALGVCQPTAVYGGTELPPGRFAVADDAVFWTSDDKIASCPLPQGCRLAPHVLVENIKRLGAITVVGPDLYFAGCTQSCDLAAHWIYHCPLSGCPIVPASSDSMGQGLFTDILAGPGHIYWWGRFGVRDRGAEYPASLFGNPLGIDYVTLGDDLYVKPTPNSGIPLFVCPQSGGCSARTELTFPRLHHRPLQGVPRPALLVVGRLVEHDPPMDLFLRPGRLRRQHTAHRRGRRRRQGARVRRQRRLLAQCARRDPALPAGRLRGGARPDRPGGLALRPGRRPRLGVLDRERGHMEGGGRWRSRSLRSPTRIVRITDVWLGQRMHPCGKNPRIRWPRSAHDRHHRCGITFDRLRSNAMRRRELQHPTWTQIPRAERLHSLCRAREPRRRAS